jgi:AcrR family transcriptional regulator
MRSVPRQLGMADAGVAHHFGTRDALLKALLRHGGRRIREAVKDGALARHAPTVQRLIDGIYSVYADGYGGLAIALHAAGWRDKGSGVLTPVVDALHNLRPRQGGRRPPRSQTQLAVAALHQALATETAYGAAFRRSASISEPAASDSGPQMKWWASTIATVLGNDHPASRAAMLEPFRSSGHVERQCYWRSVTHIYGLGDSTRRTRGRSVAA